MVQGMRGADSAPSGRPRKHRVWLHLAGIVLLCAIGSARIVSTYTTFNHTIDEPAHLAAGMEWLEGHKYTYEDLHPPLARVFAALGPHLAGIHWTHNLNMWYEGFALLGHGDHYRKVLILGRLGILLFFWVGAAVVYLWARRYGSYLTAFLSVCLYTTTPPVLAHAGLMTTDMALAAFTGASALSFLWWAENPRLTGRTVLFGICVALAVLSKFSALVFLPAAWLLMWATGAVRLRLRSSLLRVTVRLAGIRRYLVPACLAAFVCALVIWAGYRFTFHRVDYLHLRLPAPAFFTGLQSVVLRNSQAGDSVSYVLGQRRQGGFWYFFPVVLAVKTPLAMLILAGLGVWMLARSGNRLKTAAPLAFSLAILLVSLTTSIQLGVRHILPVYIGLAVVAGSVAAELFRSPRMAARIAGGLLICWQVVSGAMQHPDYIAYMNEFGGSQPERILVDSDVDWGQDMKRLGDRLHQLGVTKIHFRLFNRGYLLAGYPFAEVNQNVPQGDVPPEGWTALSVMDWKVSGSPAWADRLKPEERIGRSILLYYVPPRTGATAP